MTDRRQEPDPDHAPPLQLDESFHIRKVDGLRRLLDSLRPLGRDAHAIGTVPPIAAIPAVIAARLIPDNNDEPLFPKLKRFGRGVPGVTHEADEWWVIRDERGRVVGGAMVASIGPDHPVSIDVAVDPRRQAQGFGEALFTALEEAGIDVEAGSAASLAHRTMTPLGYAFMRSRRRQKDPDAEVSISASAGPCPGCGPLPDLVVGSSIQSEVQVGKLIASADSVPATQGISPQRTRTRHSRRQLDSVVDVAERRNGEVGELMVGPSSG